MRQSDKGRGEKPKVLETSPCHLVVLHSKGTSPFNAQMGRAAQPPGLQRRCFGQSRSVILTLQRGKPAEGLALAIHRRQSRDYGPFFRKEKADFAASAD